MKKNILSIAVIVALSSMVMAGGDIEPVEPVVETETTPVIGKSSFYLGGAYSYVTSNDTQLGGFRPDTLDAMTWNAVTLLAGYELNEYFAIEGRYVTNINGMSWDTGDDIDEDISNIALYAKASYSVEKFSVYGLLGFGQTTLTIDEIDDEDSVSSLQWGLGASFQITDALSVFVDYTRLVTDEEFDDVASHIGEELTISTTNIGLKYKF